MNIAVYLLNFLSPILGLYGSIILAFSISPVTNWLAYFVENIEKEKEEICSGVGDLFLTVGWKNNLKNFALKPSTFLVYYGIFFIFLSYLLQLAALILK